MARREKPPIGATVVWREVETKRVGKEERRLRTTGGHTGTVVGYDGFVIRVSPTGPGLLGVEDAPGNRRIHLDDIEGWWPPGTVVRNKTTMVENEPRVP